MLLDVFGVEARPVLRRPRVHASGRTVATGVNRLAVIDIPTGCLLWPRDARVDLIGIGTVFGVDVRCDALRGVVLCVDAVLGVFVDTGTEGLLLWWRRG